MQKCLALLDIPRFLSSPPHLTRTNALFSLSVLSAAGVFVQKQIDAGLASETLLGLAGHHLSSVFHYHSLRVEPRAGYFNCPSASKKKKKPCIQ